MREEYDVIVIGVGGMGAAACYHFAKRGVHVLGIEAYDIPHALGASHGHTRMARTAYHEHPNYVPLIHRANELWRELEAETRTSLLHQVGGIYMGKRDGELVSGALQAAVRHELKHTFLDHGQLSKQHGIFNLPDDCVGVFEPTAGYLMVEHCTAAHVTAALMRGAKIRCREKVICWNDRGEVHTDRGEYRAQQVVLCAGPWTAKLLDEMKLHLKVTRQQLAWFWPLAPKRFVDIPVWAIETSAGGLHYGFPMQNDLPGFKLAHHLPADVVDPDHVDRESCDRTESSLREFLQRFIPDAAGDVLSIKTCLYTNSPDQHFIIGRVPSYERVTIAAGFSGHGYKFASAVGEVLSEIVLDRTTKLSIDWLNPGRFL